MASLASRISCRRRPRAPTLVTNFWPGQVHCLACCAHQRLLFQHIHKFLLFKDVRPSKRSLFHWPPPACHSSLPISVAGANLIFTNNCLVFQTFQIRRKNRRFWIYQNLVRTARFQRRTGGYFTNSIFFFCGPWVIIHLKDEYLIFLRIVIMISKTRHDTQQGFVQFIIPAQQ